MARHTSTPGQRARQYLEAHRDVRMTALPGEHKQARQDIMSQLERQDPAVRERALVGTDRHFDRPLNKGEKEYQSYWRREEGLDVGDTQRRARELDANHGGRRRPAVPPRPSPTRPPRSRAQRAAGYIQQTAATANTITPAPVKGGLSILYGALAAGIGFSILYLFLSKPGAATSLINFAGTGFHSLASPKTTLWPAKASSSRSSLNQSLAGSASSVALTIVAAQAYQQSKNSPSGASVNAAAAAQGLHFDPSTDQYVS